MPRKFTLKNYIEQGYYHIYNLGIDRRDIFLEPEDYKTFLDYLRTYLAPFEEQTKPGFKADKPSIRSHKLNMNLHGQVELLAYCLMPNHFHLLVRQVVGDGITKLMRRVGTNYSVYFNTKYHRQGGLFESVYKAALISNQAQLVHLTRYLHLNPVSLKVSRFGPVSTVTTARPEEYEYSSYQKYLTGQSLPWFDPRPILSTFDTLITSHSSYQSFVADHRVDSVSALGLLILEGETEKR
ncbi:MAG: transposase [bacterium]|nr:transposase [bacterium]